MLTIWGYTKGTDGKFHTRQDEAEHVEVALGLAREWIESGLVKVVTVSRDEGIGDMVLARMTATPAAAQVKLVSTVIEFPSHRAAAA